MLGFRSQQNKWPFRTKSTKQFASLLIYISLISSKTEAKNNLARRYLIHWPLAHAALVQANSEEMYPKVLYDRSRQGYPGKWKLNIYTKYIVKLEHNDFCMSIFFSVPHINNCPSKSITNRIIITRKEKMINMFQNRKNPHASGGPNHQGGLLFLEIKN